jgi:hypothetical protein
MPTALGAQGSRALCAYQATAHALAFQTVRPRVTAPGQAVSSPLVKENPDEAELSCTFWMPGCEAVHKDEHVLQSQPPELQLRMTHLSFQLHRPSTCVSGLGSTDVPRDARRHTGPSEVSFDSGVLPPASYPPSAAARSLMHQSRHREPRLWLCAPS